GGRGSSPANNKAARGVPPASEVGKASTQHKSPQSASAQSASPQSASPQSGSPQRARAQHEGGPRSPMPRWPTAEGDPLPKLYPDHDNLSVARVLGRSVTSVANKAFQLGIHKSAALLAKIGRSNIAHRYQVDQATPLAPARELGPELARELAPELARDPTRA